MRYEALAPVPQCEVLRLLSDREAKEEEVVRAVIAMGLHEEDGTWAEARCYEALTQERPAVRRAAAQALGHVARVHGLNDAERAIRELQGLEGAEDALDDVAMFGRRAR